jgi:hypothetical protein
MRKPHQGLEPARVLVTTTKLPVVKIAARVGVHCRTVYGWIKREGWMRPPRAGRPVKLVRRQIGAIRRLYEGEGSDADIATVARVSRGYVSALAKKNGWVRRDGSMRRYAPPPPLAEQLAEIEARLAEGTLTRPEVVRFVDRVAVTLTGEALRTRDPLIQKTIENVARIGRFAKDMTEEPRDAAKECDCGDWNGPATFAEANDLIERIVVRIEDACAAEGIAIFADDELAA